MPTFTAHLDIDCCALPDRDRFNAFDFFIVVVGYVFMAFGESSAAVGALRMLRLARLLTFVKGVKQLRVIVAGLVQVTVCTRAQGNRGGRGGYIVVSNSFCHIGTRRVVI